jgi:ferredoxin
MNAGQRLAVDSRRCAGSGDCVTRLGSHFTWNAEGLSTPTGAPVGPDLLSIVRTIVRDCPTQAIHLEPDD